MLSKNNRLKQEFNSAKKVPHYGLRKLSIGVASVLLSTTLYLGGVAHADSTATNESEVDQTNTPSSEEPTLQKQQVTLSPQSDGSSGASQEVGAATQNPVSTDKAVVSQSAVDNSSMTSANTESETSSSAEKTPSTGLTANLAAAPSAQSSAQTQPEVDASLTSGDTIHVSNLGQISLEFKVTNPQKNDVYKIVIQDGNDQLDASGVINVQAGQRAELATTTTTNEANQQRWVIANQLLKTTQTFDQIININASRNFDNKLRSDGKYKYSIQIFRNDETTPLKTLYYWVEVQQEADISWLPDGNSRNAVTTMNGNQVKDGLILPNTDYIWDINATFNQNFNHGTTVTVPTPANFQLDLNKTESLNSQLISDYNASFVQNGQNIVITFPTLSDDQLANLHSTNHTIQLVGQFVMDQPTGNTDLAATDPIKINQNDGTSVPLTSTQTPMAVTIIGRDHNPKQIPVGQVLHLNIDPDQYDNSGDIPKAVTLKSNTAAHPMNQNIQIENVTPYKISNVSVKLTIPDGMDIKEVAGLPSSSPITYQLTYTDGTTSNALTATDGSVDSAKNIRIIEFTLPQLDAYQTIGGIKLVGNLATQYQDGSEVKVGQHVNTIMEVSSPDLKSSGTINCDQEIVDKIGDQTKYSNLITANVDQRNSEAGYVDSGEMYVEIDSSAGMRNATFYFVLPTNATLNSSNPFNNLPSDATWQEMSIKGRTVVKVVIPYVAKTVQPSRITLNLNNTSLVTRDNLNSNGQVYIVLPAGESLANHQLGTIPSTYHSDPAFVENSTHAYELSWSGWNILTALGLGINTQAQGNQDPTMTSTGYSDDHGSDKMTFNYIINNSDTKDLQNARIVTALPNTQDGKSQFNFVLNGPAKLIDQQTGQEITSGVKLLYSTQRIDTSSVNTTNDQWQQGFVTADQVSDWSKVKTVAALIDTVSAEHVYALQMTGLDPTFIDDIGKTAYASGRTWADNLLATDVKPGDKRSSLIKIGGRSKIKVFLHYTDDSGEHNVEVPSADKTYRDDIDTIKETDFTYGLTNKSANVNNDPQAVSALSRWNIPAGYAIDIEHPTIQNSTVTYPDGRPNETFQFGQVSKYDADQDEVIFNLVKLEDQNRYVKADFTTNYWVQDRNTHYVKDSDGNDVVVYDPAFANKDDDQTVLTQTINTDGTTNPVVLSISGKLNPLTGVFTLDNPDGEFSFKEFTSAKMAGYIARTDATTMANSQTLEETVTNNDDGSVTVHFNPHKMSGLAALSSNDVNKAGTKHYVLNVIFAQKVAQLWQDQLPNQNLKVIDTAAASVTNPSNIEFGTTDAELARNGYTYKVYYIGNTADTKDPNQSADDGMTSQVLGDIASWNSQKAEEYGGESLAQYLQSTYQLTPYDTLAAAVAAHPQFDSLLDRRYDPSNFGNAQSTAYYPIATQNFVVVYTPVQVNEKQEMAFTSDNDPYQKIAKLKKAALPKTDEDNIKESVDGARGSRFFTEGKAGQTPFDNQNGENDEQHLNFTDPYSAASGTYQLSDGTTVTNFSRPGYYISQVSYRYVDEQGQTKTVKILNYDMRKDLVAANQQMGMSASAPGNSMIYSSLIQAIFQQLIDPSQQTMSSIYSMLGVTDSTDPDVVNAALEAHGLSLNLSAIGQLMFDNTQYDSSKGQTDPDPQEFIIDYAKMPAQNSSYSMNVTIHYMDVDHENKPSDGIYKYGEGTEVYVNQDGTALNYITPDYNTDPATTSDGYTVPATIPAGYVIVQTDSQATPGYHEFDPLITDSTTGQYDGNTDESVYSNPDYINVTQNFYVYLKTSQKINYQIKIEDQHGNVTGTLKDPTELGVGGTDEPISTSLLDPTNRESKTIGQKYQDLLNATYAGYSVVKPNDSRTGLLKSDELPAKFDDDQSKDQLVTIYVIADQQLANVSFVDDDADPAHPETLPDAINASGVASDQITFNNLKDVIDGLKQRHFKINGVNKAGADADSLAKGEADWSTIFGQYDSDPSNVQKFIIHLGHNTQPATDKVTIHETIHYVFADGTTAHADYQAPAITFSRSGTTDLVTNHTDYDPWPADDEQTFDAEASPSITGYTPDKVKIDKQTVAPTSNDLVFTVTYNKTQPTTPTKPTEPTQPTKPTKPTTPTEPTTPTQPTTPTTPTEPTEPTKPITPTKPTEPTAPTTPTKPTEPTVPTTPTKPTEPTAPTTPTKPTEPTAPTKPTQPTIPSPEPKNPVIPERPGIPLKSEQPNKEVVPTTPGQPERTTSKSTQPRLPQTGDDKQNGLALTGLLTTGLLGMFGLKRKKRG